MKSKRRWNLIIAVAISAIFLMSSGVQAAGFLAIGGDPVSGERQIGLFEQAIQWLNGAWGDLTSVFAFSEETATPPSGGTCTTDCGDAGPGIDPEG